MAVFHGRNWIWVVGAPILFAAVALKKKSVDKSGAVAGLLVALSCTLAGLEFMLALLFFFVTATLLTRMGSKRKKKVEGDYKEGGQRNYVQVFSNGFSGTIACLALIYYDLEASDPVSIFFTGMFLGHYACCCGDTWASEAGTASKGGLSAPVLITTFKPVKAGTNGGISILGTAASALGGLGVGITFWMSGSPLGPVPCIFLGFYAGLGGSMLDSFLGATLQFSGCVEGSEKVVNEPGKGVVKICGNDILDNHQVNLVSSTLTALACGLVAVNLAGRNER